MSTEGGWGGPQQQQPQQLQQQSSPSGMAVAALLCGIGSWVVLPFVAAVAGVILGKLELGKIARGESPAAGKTFAQVGYYASIANIVVTVLGTSALCCLAFITPMILPGAAGAAGASGG